MTTAQPIASYPVGNKIVLSVEFTAPDENGDIVPVDPSTVRAALIIPDGRTIILTHEIIHDETGKYHVDVVPWISGLYTYRFVGSGSIQVAAESSFMAETDFPPVGVTS